MVGPRKALLIEVSITGLCIVALMGMARDRILFYWVYTGDVPRIWSSPVFGTLPEIVFILIGMVIGMVVPAHWASSRTLLTRLTPPERSGAYFGIYALSGTATIWLGSALVNWGTAIFGTQQGGFFGIALLLFGGSAILYCVRGGGRFKKADTGET